MADAITAEKMLNIDIESKKETDENRGDVDIISIRTARLLKIKHNIQLLRKDALQNFKEELQACKSACTDINTLLGDLNGKGGQTTDR